MTFVDTNVLLLAVSGVPEEAPKRRIAEELLQRQDLAFPVQVFQELYYQATHSKRPGKGALLLSGEDAQEYGTSYLDAAILAAANLMGCDELLSEVLNPGQVYGRVRVVNPFAGLR